jgi:hypothetical protein
MTMKDTTYSRHFGADDARAIRDAVKKDLGRPRSRPAHCAPCGLFP